MSQIDYGDYYKFAASAGIALLVAAGLLPWAFLHEMRIPLIVTGDSDRT